MIARYTNKKGKKAATEPTSDYEKERAANIRSNEMYLTFLAKCTNAGDKIVDKADCLYLTTDMDQVPQR